jgi:SNF2 family DNA or RNA helicase
MDAKNLLPHQIEDAAFLAGKSFAGNFSGMGSGKTLTALEACRLVCADRVIIVGPPISLSMWKEEFETFLPGLSAMIISTGKQVIDLDADAYIMSYEIATKRKEELKALGAKVLICDEAHALKSPTAKRTKAIIGAGGLCESVDHTWLLTGTPSTRYNDDLFTFMARADNAALRAAIGSISLERFRLKFCVTQKKKFSSRQRFPTVVTVGNRNGEELNEMLFKGDMAVRRELKDVWAQMPPLTINRLQVQLDKTPELTAALKITDGKSMNEIRQDMAAQEAHISTTRRLLGAAKVKHSVKEIISRIEAGVKPILVGAWHTDVIDALVHELRIKRVKMGFVPARYAIAVAVIDGRTSSSCRATYVKLFNRGSIDVLIGQIGAAGVSLNLQGGSHIIVVEEDWSPALMAQFYARCHRLGQSSHVHVDIFVSDTKLDQAVRRINATKRRGHDEVMAQHQERS